MQTSFISNLKMVIQFHLVKVFKRELSKNTFPQGFLDLFRNLQKGTLESQKVVVLFFLLGHLHWRSHGSGIEKMLKFLF